MLATKVNFMNKMANLAERLDVDVADARRGMGSDVLVICTEWKEFRSVDFTWRADQLAEKLVIDGRNLYAPTAVEESGPRYIDVGRRSHG